MWKDHTRTYPTTGFVGVIEPENDQFRWVLFTPSSVCYEIASGLSHSAHAARVACDVFHDGVTSRWFRVGDSWKTVFANRAIGEHLVEHGAVRWYVRDHLGTVRYKGAVRVVSAARMKIVMAAKKVSEDLL